ncbi:fibronectin [Bacillus thuringiensis]|nr:fibronectin [Bacillus thuringiensis]RFB51626.1 fibronectin [Bacillus thuringiensis]
MPTDIHLPPKIGISHLHIFEEGVFCRKTIKTNIRFNKSNIQRGESKCL